MLELAELNFQEAIRYLGSARVPVNDTMTVLMEECEKLVLEAAVPKFRYEVRDLPWLDIMAGEDVVRHLDGCEKAVLMCATLGAGVDKLLRVMQVQDMAKAVVIDALASVAIEQVCEKFDDLIHEEYPDWYQTFRFSPGYGDYPIEMQRTVLQLLDAPRKIGLTVNDSMLLVPTKSETAVMGLSREPIKKGPRGCATCNLKETCQFRKSGGHCKE